MKKGLLLFCLAFSFVMLQAQTVIFSDNFDSYTAEQLLCVQDSIDWTTWNNAPGGDEDAYISTEQAASGSNSLKIVGTSVIIYPFDNQTTGVYEIDFNCYIPSEGKGAYFSIQHYIQLGQKWAFECVFNRSGMALLLQNQNYTSFSFPTDAWFPVKMVIDLDNDILALLINGQSVETMPFSYTSDSNNGACQLGALTFYPGPMHGTYYVDDFVFSQLPADWAGIEEYSNSSIRIYPNPASDLLNISSEKETFNAEIINLDGQLVKTISGHFSNIGISDLSDGFYFVKVYTETGTETLKFIKK